MQWPYQLCQLSVLISYPRVLWPREMNPSMRALTKLWVSLGDKCIDKPNSQWEWPHYRYLPGVCRQFNIFELTQTADIFRYQPRFPDLSNLTQTHKHGPDMSERDALYFRSHVSHPQLLQVWLHFRQCRDGHSFIPSFLFRSFIHPSIHSVSFGSNFFSRTEDICLFTSTA